MKTLPEKFSRSWLRIIQDICWAQWNRLGLMGTGGLNQCSIDIEAALVLSARVMQWDGRLLEGIYSWLERYESIVNGERLSRMIRHSRDETVANVLGGLIEAGPFKTLHAVLKSCRKLSSKNCKLTVEKPAKSKLNEHRNILKSNIGMRYRYLYGTSLRADVLYLLSVSHQCQNKRDIDYLTTVRLADVHLGCDRSTVYRLQKDLEEGGILVPQYQLRNQYIVTWTAKDASAFLKQTKQEVGLIRWICIADLLLALLRLMEELKEISDESIARFRINKFHTEYFLCLIDHGVKVPIPYGSDLGPLKEHRLEDLAEMTTQALQAFYDLVTKVS